MTADDISARIAALQAEFDLLRNDLREQGIHLYVDERSGDKIRLAGAYVDDALRKTQVEHYTRLQTAIDAGFAEMRAGFAETRAGLQAIAELIERNTPPQQ